MKITFCGAARTVTGSMHLLDINGYRILLDCGLFQGRRALTYERNLNFPFDPAEIDTLILSHAHIDHSGNIPNLVRKGFQGNIFCTSATRDLCAYMLLDSARIQEQDVAYLNRKKTRDGEEPVEPLYTEEDALASLDYFISLPYQRPLQIVPGVTLTFYDAGHILGSAITMLEWQEQGESRRLVFSGDLGRKGMSILRDPTSLTSADVVIMESTYGDRDHASMGQASSELRQLIIKTYRQGGKVLVPAFAVGRTQELVYTLHQLAHDRKLPSLPIFVDSPLAVNVTEVFRLHPEAYNEEVRRFMEHDLKHHSPFGFDQLTYIRKVTASKELNFLREPAVIIAASGMCEGGRILHHLKHNIGDPLSAILFVGFQAEHTLGRKILDGVSPVKIFGEEFDVRAKIKRIEGYSAHADRTDLRQWASHFDKTRLAHLFLVHGEEQAATSLAADLGESGIRPITIPAYKDAFTV